MLIDETGNHSYGINVLNLTLVRGYLRGLFANKRINSYLQANAADLYDPFQDIVLTDSLDSGQ